MDLNDDIVLRITADASGAKEEFKEVDRAVEAMVQEVDGSITTFKTYREFLDRLSTDTLRKLNAGLINNKQALREMQSELDRDAAAMARAHAAALKLTGGHEGLAASAYKVGAGFRSAMGGLTGFISTAALGYAIKQTVEYVGHLQDLSAKTGLGVKALQELKFAGSQVGVSLDNVSTAVSQLQNHLAKGDKSAVAAVKDLGLNLNALRNMKPEDQFYTVARALAGVTDQTKFTADGMALMGKGFAQVAPLIRSGLDDMREKAHKFGVVLSDETIKQVGELDDALDVAKVAGMAFIANALVPMVPALTKVLNAALPLGKWLGDNLPGYLKKAQLEFEAFIGVLYKLAAASTSVEATALEWQLSLNPGMRAFDEVTGSVTKKIKDLRAESLLYSDTVKGIQVDIANQTDGTDKLTTSVESYIKSLDVPKVDTFSSALDRSGEAALRAATKHEKAAEKIRLAWQKLQADIVRTESDHGQGIKPALFGTGIGTVNQVEGDAGAMAMMAAWEMANMRDGLSSTNLGGYTYNPLGPYANKKTWKGSGWNGFLNNNGLNPYQTGSNGKPIGWGNVAGNAFGMGMNIYGGASNMVSTFKDPTLSKGKTVGSLAGQGAAIGTMIMPGWGTAIGAGVGALVGLFKGNPNKKADKEATGQIGDIQNQLMGTYGSLKSIDAIGKIIGVDLAGAWGDKSVKGLEHFQSLVQQFQGTLQNFDLVKYSTDAVAAGNSIPPAFAPFLKQMAEAGTLTDNQVKSLMGLKDTSADSFHEMEDAAGRLGIKLSDLGPAFQQAKLDETATQVAADMKTLVDGGTDLNVVLAGSSKQLGHLVQEAVKGGLTLPDTLKPYIEKLKESHQLLDDNGQEITDLSKLSFAKTLEESVGDLITKLDELITTMTGKGGVTDAIGKIPKDVTVNVHGKWTPMDDFPDQTHGGQSGEQPGGPSAAPMRVGGLAGAAETIYAQSGLDWRRVFRQRDSDQVPAMLTRGERVFKVDHNERMVRAMEQGTRGGVTVHVHGDIYDAEQKFYDKVERAVVNGLTRRGMRVA